MIKLKAKPTLLITFILVGSFQLILSQNNYSFLTDTIASSNINSAAYTYPIINVSDYSGETDQERIQKALDSVPPEGAIVFIPKGIWEACNLTAKSKTIIMGTKETILKPPENTTLPFIIFENQTDFAVINLTFDGQNISKATGILIANGQRFYISNNSFKNIDERAVYIYGASQNFKIEDNLFVNSNTAPILIFGSPGVREVSHFTIYNNTIINASENGKIAIAFASDGELAKNYVANCEYGIGTRDISNITITGNVIKNCNRYGIYLGTQPGDPGSWNITIINNLIINSSVGIARYYGDHPIYNVIVKNNTIIHNTEWDIYADFKAAFLHNTITSKEKVKIAVLPSEFTENVDLNGRLIMPADVNEDGKVDMWDLGVIARLYGINENFNNWNQKADIIQDGVIDMKDISLASKEFGLHT